MVLETSGGYIVLRREINSESIKLTYSTKVFWKEKKRLAYSLSLQTEVDDLTQDPALFMAALVTSEQKWKKVFQGKLMYVSFSSIKTYHSLARE